jgi:adenylate cyclase
MPPVPQTTNLAVLIADIVHSTALYEQVGNVAARQAVGGCLGMLSDVTKSHDGRVIKTMGDGILCTFPTAERAVNSALSMCDGAPTHGLEIRVGVHYGEVVEEDDDIFGDAVNTAARVSDLAKPGEILITRDLRETLPDFLVDLVQGVQPVLVKGKRDPIELFAILKDGMTGTVVAHRPAGWASAVTVLELKYGDRTIQVDRDRNVISIGREQSNDLVVASEWTSRHHARVQFRSSKFLFADQSANGTYLVPQDLGKLFVHREETLLLGSGRIYLGADPDTQQIEPILFRLIG